MSLERQRRVAGIGRSPTLFLMELVMNSKSVSLVLRGVLCLSWTLAVMASGADDPKSKETPDQRFEKLLAAAMNSPEKADWISLREAFSRTTHYHPYSIEVDEKLKEIAKVIGRGQTKQSELALLKLIENERFMRFDSLAMLMMLYENTEQSEKAVKYKRMLEGILEVLKYPKAGTSIENPIQILFVQEEYLVTTNMPIKGRGLMINQGHRFDVFELLPEGDMPGKKIYFSIDLLQNAKSILDK
jgi:hypothetical protein